MGFKVTSSMDQKALHYSFHFEHKTQQYHTADLRAVERGPEWLCLLFFFSL